VAPEGAIQELELAGTSGDFFQASSSSSTLLREKKRCDTLPTGAIVSFSLFHSSHPMISLSIPQLETIFQRLSVGMVDFNASKASMT
jgi:hypothetical protein